MLRKRSVDLSNSFRKSATMTTSILTSLRFKISLFIIILLLVTASIFYLLTIQTLDRHILDEVIKRAVSLCKSTAALAPYRILSNDTLGIDNIVSKVKETNVDVEYVVVTDPNMNILAHSDVTKRGMVFHTSPGDMLIENSGDTRIAELYSIGGTLLEIHTPVVFDNKQLGNVIIGINKSVLLATRSETQKRVIAGLGVVLILGIGCIIVLSSFVTRPIKELSKGVYELKEGRKSKLRIYSQDELGALTASFNQMTEMITSQRASLNASARELEDAYISTVKVLAAAIDARDPHTLGHSTRVAKLSLKIGEALRLSRQELDDLEIASLFHDVGKLKTSDFILHKEGPLNPLEYREITDHPEHGAAILSRATSLQKYIPAVRHHHEWFNGEGYPDGLRGDDIPVHAAIIAVADAFDAMTSSRPYKDPRSREDALCELIRFSGKQFDPSIVDIFHEVIDDHPTIIEEFSTRG